MSNEKIEEILAKQTEILGQQSNMLCSIAELLNSIDRKLSVGLCSIDKNSELPKFQDLDNHWRSVTEVLTQFEGKLDKQKWEMAKSIKGKIDEFNHPSGAFTKAMHKYWGHVIPENPFEKGQIPDDLIEMEKLLGSMESYQSYIHDEIDESHPKNFKELLDRLGELWKRSNSTRNLNKLRDMIWEAVKEDLIVLEEPLTSFLTAEKGTKLKSIRLDLVTFLKILLVLVQNEEI
jgi:hypothetical protein